MEGKVRVYLTSLREDAFLEIKEGYVDSGAALGKDTRWKDVAQLKPQTTTKEEVTARRKRHLLWVIPAGTVKDNKSKGNVTPAAVPAPTPPPAPAADKAPDKSADKTPDPAAAPEKK
jgi:hypothetical protein